MRVGKEMIAGLVMLVGGLLLVSVPMAHAQATKATVSDVWATIVCSWRGHAPSTKPMQIQFAAASDSEADQAIKAQVGDAVTPPTVELIKGVKSQDEAVSVIAQNLAQIEAWGQGVVGDSYRVSAVLTRRHLPASLQGADCLPAGDYDVLEITIRQGEGLQ